MSHILRGISDDSVYHNNSYNRTLPEGISQEDLTNALFYRLERLYPDIISRYGHERVGDAVIDVASSNFGIEELGTSDISIMVREVLRELEKFPIDESNSNVTNSTRDLLIQARKITSEYRYADMHLSIISKIQSLAENSTVNKNDLEYLINQVYEKQKELESAIFALDEPFEEAARREEWNDNVDEGQIYAQGGGYGEAQSWYIPKDNLGENKEVNEDLRKWFKEKWVRFGPDGKIRGSCARGDDSEGKPKCLPQSKAHSLGKKGRASAASRKRREDPNPERSGKAINVATKKKSNEGMAEEQLDELKCWPGYTRVRGVPAGAPGSCKKKTSEDQAQMFTPESKCPHCNGELVSEELMNEKKDACYYKVKSRYKVWPSAYASGALVKCRKKGADNWGTGGKKNEGMVMGVSSDASSAGSKVQGEAANSAQQAAIAIAMKKAGKKPKGESAIMKGLVDEMLGTPYPGTYEQETKAFSKRGQKRLGDLTNE